MQDCMKLFSAAEKLFVWWLRVQKARPSHCWHWCTKSKICSRYKYLGIVLDIELSDDKDIQRQMRCQYEAVNKLRASFSQFWNAVKNVLIRSFCRSMYRLHHNYWCDFRKAYIPWLRAAYNFGCRVLYNLPWRAGGSSYQVQCNLPTCEALF